MAKSIYEELKACTVRIVNKNTRDEYSVKGTGFFIEKNTILTCYHLMDSDNLKVIWNDTEYEIVILEEKKDLDLILLKVDAGNEKFVEIDNKVNIRDKCYAFGFPNNEDENKELPKELQLVQDGITFEVVDENDGIIKFKGEQFKEGFSGSPVLNEESKKVCSIISLSRETDELKGGYGISLEKLNYKVDKNQSHIIYRDGYIEPRTVYVKKLNMDIAVCPVTIEEYELFCKNNNYKIPYGNNLKKNKKPVINVDWNKADEYCRWLKEKSDKNYRLPSSKDWEFIALLNMSDKNLEDYIVCREDFKKNPKIAKVGSKKNGKLNIFDMPGNIYEWCFDNSNNEKIIKGSTYNTSLKNIDIGKIESKSVNDYNNRLGFRIIF